MNIPTFYLILLFVTDLARYSDGSITPSDQPFPALSPGSRYSNARHRPPPSSSSDSNSDGGMITMMEIDQCPSQCQQDPNQNVPMTARSFAGSSRGEASARSWEIHCYIHDIEDISADNYFICDGQCAPDELAFNRPYGDDKKMALCTYLWQSIQIPQHRKRFSGMLHEGYHYDLAVTRPGLDATYYDADYIRIQAWIGDRNHTITADACMTCHELLIEWQPEWTGAQLEVWWIADHDEAVLNIRKFDTN